MFDVDEFIKNIRASRALWDKGYEFYSNEDACESEWEEIGEHMYDDWYDVDYEKQLEKIKEMKRKWKQLKDNFYKFVNQEKNDGAAPQKKKKYVYADALTFLLNMTEKKKTQEESDDDSDGGGLTANVGSIEAGPSNQPHKSPQARNRPRSKLQPLQNEQSKTLQSTSNQEEDADTLTFLPNTTEKRKTPENREGRRGEKRKHEKEEEESEDDSDGGGLTANVGSKAGPSNQPHKVPQARNRPRSKLQPLQNKQPKTLQSTSKQEEDADRSFLMSLLPDYKKLNDDEKIEFRCMTLQFFRDIRTRKNFQNVSSGPFTQLYYPPVQLPSINLSYPLPNPVQAPSSSKPSLTRHNTPDNPRESYQWSSQESFSSDDSP